MTFQFEGSKVNLGLFRVFRFPRAQFLGATLFKMIQNCPQNGLKVLKKCIKIVYFRKKYSQNVEKTTTNLWRIPTIAK